MPEAIWDNEHYFLFDTKPVPPGTIGQFLKDHPPEPPITHPNRAVVVLLACALALGLALWVTG